MKPSFAEFIKAALDIGETIIWRSYPEPEAMAEHVRIQAKAGVTWWSLILLFCASGAWLELNNRLLFGNNTSIFIVAIEASLLAGILLPITAKIIRHVREYMMSETIARNTVYVVTDKNLFVVDPDVLWGGWKYEKYNLWVLQGLIIKEFLEMPGFGNIYFVQQDYRKTEKKAEQHYYSREGFMFVKDLENVANLIEKVKARHFHNRA